MDKQKNTDSPRETVSAEVMPVIKVKVKVGNGTEDNPNRIITQYWSLNGHYLAEACEQKELTNNSIVPCSAPGGVHQTLRQYIESHPG